MNECAGVCQRAQGRFLIAEINIFCIIGVLAEAYECMDEIREWSLFMVIYLRKMQEEDVIRTY